MGYAKLSVDKVLAENPDISVADLAAQSVEDHSRDNGCIFQDDAATRIVNGLGFDPNARAADLSEDDRESLALGLETMETHCRHKGVMPVAWRG